MFFSSAFHFLPSHSIIQHILFAFRPSPESVVVNYLFRLHNLGILKSVTLLSLLWLLLLLLWFPQSFLKKRSSY